MQTLCVEINQANLQESLDQMDELVKKASFTIADKGNPYHERKFHRSVKCFHDTVVTLDRGKQFLIRGVEFTSS